VSALVLYSVTFQFVLHVIKGTSVKVRDECL
jgi:hypothetical protein